MFVGRTARQAFWVVPPLRALDSAGGVMLGALTGLALCWAVGAVLLYVPGQSELRRLAQESAVVSALTEAVPPERVMDAVGRIDPFTAFAGPDVDVGRAGPGDRRASRRCAPRGNSVVRVHGVACGLGVEGSGWIVRRGLVVTNAHVVAGIAAPLVDRGGGNAVRGEVVCVRRRERRRARPRRRARRPAASPRGGGRAAPRARSSASRSTGRSR